MTIKGITLTKPSSLKNKQISQLHCKDLMQLRKLTPEKTKLLINVNEWLQSLQVAIINRDEFLHQIIINKQDKKISQLKSSELTG